jgi:hypothetical protein
MLLIFAALVAVLIVTSAATAARPRNARDWTLVWAVLVFLTWALVGFGWLRSV